LITGTNNRKRKRDRDHKRTNRHSWISLPVWSRVCWHFCCFESNHGSRKANLIVYHNQLYRAAGDIRVHEHTHSHVRNTRMRGQDRFRMRLVHEFYSSRALCQRIAHNKTKESRSGRIKPPRGGGGRRERERLERA